MGVYSGGAIYIDVNAGRNKATEDMSRVAIVRTAAHELTHFMKEYAPGEYRELQSFLLNKLSAWDGLGLQDLINRKMARSLKGEMSPEEAADEVTADGCEMMLEDSQLISMLAPSLKDRIGEFISSWAAAVRLAFMDVEASSEEAVALMSGHAKELQRLWDKGMAAAVRNAQEAGIKENAAEDGGGVHYSNRYNPIREALAKQGLDELSKKLGPYFPLSAQFDSTMRADNRKPPMEVVTENQVPRGAKSQDFSIGRKVFNTAYGGNTDIYIPQIGITADLNSDIIGESITRAQKLGNVEAVLDLIPHIRNILKNSTLFGVERIVHTYNKGTAIYGYRLYAAYWNKQSTGIFTPGIIASTIVQDTRKANAYIFTKIENVTSGPATLPGGNHATYTTGDRYSISQLYNAVKNIPRAIGGLKYTAKEAADYLFSYTETEKGDRYSERDYTPEDSELLLMAAAEDGASERLTAYAKKYRKMEAAKRVAEDIDAQIRSAATDEEKKAILESSRAAVDKYYRYEEALYKMANKPEMKYEARKQLAKWQERNAKETAETLIFLKEQNRALKEYVEFYKEQAKNTAPGQQSVRPEDIRTLARTLIKEQYSYADQAEVAEQLQAMGDYIVRHSGADIDFRELQKMAMEAAETIVAD